MAIITVTLEEMSLEEAKAWIHAIMDKYGSGFVMKRLEERKKRFEVANRLPDIEAEINEAK